METYKKIIGELFSASRYAAAQSFKSNIRKRLDYYHDRQLPYLEELIRQQFVHADPLAVQPHFFNIVKPIVNETAMIYRSGARRALVSTDGEVDPAVQRLWQTIQNWSRYDAVMKTVNRMVNLCGTVLVRPAFRQNRIKLDIITPDLVDVIPAEDDPTEGEGIAYTRPNPDPAAPFSYIIHYWDSETYIKFTPNGDIIRDPDNPDGINPYGVLPFVRFVNQLPTDSFFVRAGDDLIIAQDNINIKLTQLNYLVKMQSFSIPVLRGYQGPDRITISPGKPIVIPLGTIGQGEPDFRFETPHPQIGELIKLLEHEIIRIFRAYGIGSADFSLQGEVKSGFALVMENLKLLESRENELPFYEDAEEELFEVIKRVWNYHSRFLPAGHPFRGVRIPESVHLRVSVNDISLPKPAGEEIAEWKFMLQNRLATPIDFLMRRYKLSESEARERWEEIRKWWEENLGDER